MEEPDSPPGEEGAMEEEEPVEEEPMEEEPVEEEEYSDKAHADSYKPIVLHKFLRPDFPKLEAAGAAPSDDKKLFDEDAEKFDHDAYVAPLL